MDCQASRSFSSEESHVDFGATSAETPGSGEWARRPHFKEMAVTLRRKCFNAVFELRALQNVKAPIIGARNFAFRQKFAAEAGNKGHAGRFELYGSCRSFELIEHSNQFAVLESKLHDTSALDDELESIFAT